MSRLVHPKFIGRAPPLLRIIACPAKTSNVVDGRFAIEGTFLCCRLRRVRRGTCTPGHLITKRETVSLVTAPRHACLPVPAFWPSRQRSKRALNLLHTQREPILKKTRSKLRPAHAVAADGTTLPPASGHHREFHFGAGTAECSRWWAGASLRCRSRGSCASTRRPLDTPGRVSEHRVPFTAFSATAHRALASDRARGQQ